MGMIAAAVRELIAAGLSGPALADAVERIEEAAEVHVDEQAERRRAYDRDRKRAERLRKSAESADVMDAAPDKEKSPTPPKEINPSPSLRSGSVSAREDAEFSEFWSLYPNKVGKPKARTSFATARRRSDFEPIMDGLRRYIRTKPPDRDWLNPATFLNQERWNDEPAPAPQRPAGPAASRQQSILDGMAQAVERRMRVGGWEAEADARRRGDGSTGPPDWGGDSENGKQLATGTG